MSPKLTAAEGERKFAGRINPAGSFGGGRGRSQHCRRPATIGARGHQLPQSLQLSVRTDNSPVKQMIRPKKSASSKSLTSGRRAI